jgi:ribosomal protein L24
MIRGNTMTGLKIKKGDKVKFDNGGLWPHYGTVKRVNKVTYTIVDEQGDCIRIPKENVWWD